MDKSRVGAGGGSCGVTQAVNVSRRHPEVKSLVLLAGSSDAGGRRYLLQNAWLPVFASAAADDQFGAGIVTEMRWLAELNGNPRNTFVGFKDGKHGTEIFGPHPELPKEIVAWYVDTLVKEPADPKTPVTAKRTPASEFWTALDSPGGVEKAAALFHEARQKDPNAYLFPENVLNLAGYERLQAGATKEAVAIFQLNVEAYPQCRRAGQPRRRISGGRSERSRARGREEMPRDAGGRQGHRRIQEGHPRERGGENRQTSVMPELKLGPTSHEEASWNGATRSGRCPRERSAPRGCCLRVGSLPRSCRGLRRRSPHAGPRRSPSRTSRRSSPRPTAFDSCS